MSTKRYRLLEPAYVDNQLRKAGETVTTDLKPGKHMLEIPDAAAPAAEDAAAVDWPFAT